MRRILYIYHLPLLLLSFLPLTHLQAQDSLTTLRLASWNIQDFGRSKDKEEMLLIAQHLREFDLVAIQEVVSNNSSGPKAVARLADELDRMGHDWDYRISDPTDSPGSKTERYAFLWKTDRVKLLGKTWLESSLPDTVFREPYLARFEFNGDSILIASFHARRGADRPEEEVPLLARLIDRYPKETLIFVGDFNLNDSHPAFDRMKQKGYKPAFKNQPTSLRQTCTDRYFSGNLDHIFLPPSIRLLRSGIVDTVGECANLKMARALSDHVPLWAEIVTGD